MPANHSLIAGMARSYENQRPAPQAGFPLVPEWRSEMRSWRAWPALLPQPSRWLFHKCERVAAGRERGWGICVS